jgi:hypothetical protein
MICERALGLARGKRLELTQQGKNLLEALDYDLLADGTYQEEAVTCARHFAGVRDGLFTTYPWVFARRNSVLSQTSGSMAGWRFVFAPPAGCVKIHELVQPLGTTPAYEQAHGKIGCNVKTVSARYSVIVEDTDDWPMLFQDAFCGRLAHEISLAVSGDPELGAQAFQLFQFAISEGYRTGAIDPGARLDNNLSDAAWNTTRLFSPSPSPAAARTPGNNDNG